MVSLEIWFSRLPQVRAQTKPYMFGGRVEKDYSKLFPRQDLIWRVDKSIFVKPVVKELPGVIAELPAKRYSLENKTLRVTVYLEEPFVVRRTPKPEENGVDHYEGYCIDLLRMISEICRFNYTIHEVRDRVYGSKEGNGKWNGMVGELQSGEADLAVASLTISYSRSEVIDFSVPPLPSYMHLGISILFRRPEVTAASLSTFLAPLSPPVWAFVFLAYAATSCVIWILSNISPYESIELDDFTGSYRAIKNQFSLGNSYWFAVSSLMQQGSELTPRAGSVRIATAIWWMFALILISSYTANLAAFLTTKRMAAPVENADDLSRQMKIKYGTLARGSTMTFFNESRIDTYERMWKVMTGQPGHFVESSSEGIARVKGGDYAYLMESSMLEYAVERDCHLMQIGGLLDQKGYGIGLPKGSPYREQISSAILQLQEKTMLTELKDKWWKDKNTVCSRASRIVGEGDGSDSIDGVFILLLLGIGLALVIAIAERFYKRCFKEGKAEAMLEKSFWSELRRALCSQRQENKHLKQQIDELIRMNARDGKPAPAYENVYPPDALRIHSE